LLKKKEKKILIVLQPRIASPLLMTLNPTSSKCGRPTNEKANPILHSFWGRERERERDVEKIRFIPIE
jgi:hypothetical protein